MLVLFASSTSRFTSIIGRTTAQRALGLRTTAAVDGGISTDELLLRRDELIELVILAFSLLNLNSIHKNATCLKNKISNSYVLKNQKILRYKITLK